MAATYETIHRPSASQPSAACESEDTPRKNRLELKIVWPFTIPSTPEAAGDRMIKNVTSLSLYYFQFMFIVLFVSLIPQRKVSLIILVAIKEIAFLYLLLLRSAAIINKFIDRRVVFFLLGVITSVLLVVTGAGVHLLAVLGSVTPIILLHAALWTGVEVAAGGGDDGGELPLVNRTGHGDDDSKNLV